MSQSHREVFIRAMEALAGITKEDLDTLFTEDVEGWSPRLGVRSLDELAEALEDRDQAMSNLALVLTGFDVVGNKAMAEWRLEADNTGPVFIGDELISEPTGRHVHMAGATFADFRGDRIYAFRTYFDDVALMEQVLVTG